MFKGNETISGFDDEVAEAISAENTRQEEHIELIASENYASPRTLEAQGSVLTNKYAEGYPNKRYYGGCEHVDTVELLAIERAKTLFGADFANVQPHSGSSANSAVYLALLNAGDTVLGMSLADGGHLTHGSSVNFSGKLYKTCFYNVEKESEIINYEKVHEIAKKEKPNLIICGASAYSRDWDYKKFREIADEVDAILMADIAHPAGLIAAKLLNIEPENCIVFEDSVAGVQAANTAKMISIGIGSEEVLGEADYVFKDFTEISEKFINTLINN